MWDPAWEETPSKRPPSHSSISMHPPARRHSRDHIHDTTKFEGHIPSGSSADLRRTKDPPGDSMFTASTARGSAPEAVDALLSHMGDSSWEDAPYTQALQLDDTSNNSRNSNHIPLEQSFTTLKTNDDLASGPASTSSSMNIPPQATSIAPAGLPLSPSPKMPLPEAAPCVAHLFIPQSHRAQFAAVLAAPPDLALKIKKSIRFRREPPTSKRRGAESPVAFSSIKSSSLTKSLPGSSVKSASPRFANGALGNFGSSCTGSNSSSLKAYGGSIVEKDPEEKIAELMELKQMKIRQEDLFHLKDQITHLSQNLEDKESILDEVRMERKSLQSELARYIAMVKQIQRDVALATQAEVELSKEREQLSRQVSQLKDNDYKILKEEVDQLRSKKGLRPLPSLEQEQAEVMGRYLEQRRGQWRQDGLLQEHAGSPANHIHHCAGPSSTEASSSFTGAAPSGRSSNVTSGSGSGSYSGPGPVSRSSPRATTSSSSSLTSRTRNQNARPDRKSQPSDSRRTTTSSSDTSRLIKAQTTRSSAVRPSVATSRSSGRQSQRSSPGSSRSRSQSPSVRSSSSSIPQGSKKRSRY